MKIAMLLYPVSIFCVMGFIGALLCCNVIILGSLCVFSSLHCITIKPILTIVDHYINTVFRKQIKRVRHNIRKSFIVSGNMTNKKQAIYILHPHGMYSLTHAFHIRTAMTNWPHRNISSVMHTLLSRVPFALDFIAKHKFVNSTYSDMKDALIRGTSLSICIGNFSEGKYTADDSITTIIKHRTGVFKMAIETGTPLIPVISFGEQSVFRKFNSYGLFEYMSRISTIEINVPTIKSCLKWLNIYFEPLENPVKTYIGDPVSVGNARIPTPDEVVALRTKYISALKLLYRRTKPNNYIDDIIIV